LNLLIFLLIWLNLRFWNICQVFHTCECMPSSRVTLTLVFMGEFYAANRIKLQRIETLNFMILSREMAWVCMKLQENVMEVSFAYCRYFDIETYCLLVTFGAWMSLKWRFDFIQILTILLRGEKKEKSSFWDVKFDGFLRQVCLVEWLFNCP